MMAARLRALAVLAGLFVCGVDCAPAGAQTRSANSPQADQVEEPENDPPAVASVPAKSAPDAPPAAEVAAPAAGAATVPIASIARTTVTHAGKAHYAGPIATLPGFEMLPDGGSRLFVEVSQSVGVEEKKTARALTYVLKGTRVAHRNNENALVTVHFNTPVARARLLPSGRDLLFSVDLRADAVPAWKVVSESDGSATLQIDFPRGSFLPAEGAVDMTNPAPPVAAEPRAAHDTVAPEPRATRNKYGAAGARRQHSGAAPAPSPAVGD